MYLIDEVGLIDIKEIFSFFSRILLLLISEKMSLTGLVKLWFHGL